MPPDPLLRQCIVHWAHLPRICQLIGLQCRRSLFLRASTYSRLDPIGRRFLCLPFSVEQPHARLQAAGDPNETVESPATAALAAGLRHIESRLRPLPSALRQRLTLLFPRELSAYVVVPASSSDTGRHGMAFNLNLFHQAVNHALLEPASLS
ncbi:hypothetical protein WJ69_34180 [Burkholderia ubonensis]|nr:hypothetical protein WJ69_34180 [Burkholderia ubonensis]